MLQNEKDALDFILLQNQALNIFANNTPQFVFWKDKDCVFLGCNDNFATSAGLANKEEIVGKTDYDLPWSKEESDFFRKIDKKVMAAGKPLLNFEEPQTLENGETKWLRTSKIPLVDKENNVIGIIGWYLDITIEKEMRIEITEKNKALLNYNAQLKSTNKELELANLDLEKFTYAASHDLKSPIRTIMSFAQILKAKEEEQFDDESKEILDYVINSANRMHFLIEDILNYAKTGVKQGKPAAVDINEIIAAKILDLKQLIDSKSVKIDLNLPTEPIPCHAHLIGLVFYNLLNNAIKFNQSEPPQIQCDYSESDHFWTFTVKDNGIGIKPDYTEKVFEPFKRLVGNNYEGSGIGLSICKRVANIHKGKIWLEENPSGGTIFHFSISKHL